VSPISIADVEVYTGTTLDDDAYAQVSQAIDAETVAQAAVPAACRR
jgi:hypothetical protein